MSAPLPDTDFAPTRGFWAAAARGELAIPRCASCRRYVWYPHDVCPGCGGREIPWETVSGRGTLFSWARVERALFAPFAGKVPYVAALVALEEDPGVRVVTNVLQCDAADLAVDMPVRVVFRDLVFEGSAGRVTAPFFVPDRSRP